MQIQSKSRLIVEYKVKINNDTSITLYAVFTTQFILTTMNFQLTKSQSIKHGYLTAVFSTKTQSQNFKLLFSEKIKF